MRICPQCSRKNKPRAKYCDHCGFEFIGYAGSAAPTQRAAPPPVDPLPPGDTAKGVPSPQADALVTLANGSPSQAGVPHEVSDGKGVHRQTQKLTAPMTKLAAPMTKLPAPMVAAGTPTAKTSHSQETIKVARVPAPTRPIPPPSDSPDPEPEATMQGAFYLRKQQATHAASAETPVGWLVESVGSSKTPGTMWPVLPGMTLMGSDQAAVGAGVAADRPGLAHLHALLFHRHEQTWLVDLDSGGTTSCNGVPLSPLQGHLLTEGDQLRLGELILSFRRADPQPDAGT